MKRLKEQIGFISLTIGFICLASDTEINASFWVVKAIGIALFAGGAILAGWIKTGQKSV